MSEDASVSSINLRVVEAFRFLLFGVSARGDKVSDKPSFLISWCCKVPGTKRGDQNFSHRSLQPGAGGALWLCHWNTKPPSPSRTRNLGGSQSKLARHTTRQKKKGPACAFYQSAESGHKAVEDLIQLWETVSADMGRACALVTRGGPYRFEPLCCYSSRRRVYCSAWRSLCAFATDMDLARVKSGKDGGRRSITSHKLARNLKLETLWPSLTTQSATSSSFFPDFGFFLSPSRT